MMYPEFISVITFPLGMMSGGVVGVVGVVRLKKKKYLALRNEKFFF